MPRVAAQLPFGVAQLQIDGGELMGGRSDADSIVGTQLSKSIHLQVRPDLNG